MAAATANADKTTDGPYLFNRIATFNICEQIDVTCNTDIATNAETVWYFEKQDSSTTDSESDSLHCLVYTNSESQNLGFVDITNPFQPKAAGEVDLGGEPTTVRVIGNYGTLMLTTTFVSLIILT
jgi:hypothetical protein